MTTMVATIDDQPLEIGEEYYANRAEWLRAAVPGADDGLLATASLMAGVSGIIAEAMSIAAGEYVSVSSQADSEAAHLEHEKPELKHHRERELGELAEIYSQRGLHPPLARKVAEALTETDALDADARDERGLTETNAA